MYEVISSILTLFDQWHSISGNQRPVEDLPAEDFPPCGRCEHYNFFRQTSSGERPFSTQTTAACRPAPRYWNQSIFHLERGGMWKRCLAPWWAKPSLGTLPIMVQLHLQLGELDQEELMTKY